jgi:pimeloyl-ACP methyl ester carboxylesterase
VRDVFVAGVRSAVVDVGERGAPEAVVFVHGNPGPLDDWEFVLETVAQRARAIALDMPGFGRAERPRHFDVSTRGYARYLGGVLRELGVARAHLVLHDFGGAWGLAWALEHPGALASVTLINSVPASAFRWHFFARVWQTPVLGELFQLSTTDFAIRHVMQRDNPRPLPADFIARVLRFTDVRQKMLVMKLYRSARDTRATFATMAEPLSRLRAPACVIWGASDPYLPPSHGEALAHIFADSELHLLPGLGHWPFIDDPDAVRGALLPFLERTGALGPRGDRELSP